MRRGRARRLALATAALGSALALGQAPVPSSAHAVTPHRVEVRASATAGIAGVGTASTTRTGTDIGSTAAHTPTTGSAEEGLAVSLDQVAPVVTTDGTVTVEATVRNTSGRPLDDVVVGVRQKVAPMTDRDAVAQWAASHGTADGGLLASSNLPDALGPGESARVSLDVTDVGAGRSSTYGTIGVSVDAVSGSASGRQHSFLGYQRVKQFQPLSLAVGVPLVLDADAALTGTSAARKAAWERVSAPSSRLSRIVDGTRGQDVSWLLDPELVQPVATVPAVQQPSATTSGTAPPTTSATSPTSPTDRTSPTNPTTPSTSSPAPTASSPMSPVSSLGYAASAQEERARQELAARIRTGATQHPTVLLPSGDPDVVAAAAAPSLGDTVASLVTDATLGLDGLRATSGVAWPADGSWSADVENAARRAYGARLQSALVDSRWTTQTQTTPSAPRRSADGLPLVVYDDALSRLLARATSGPSGTVATQQLVADTAALVSERPGTARSVAAVAPRDLDPDPAALAGMLGALQQVPWITTTSLRALVDDARDDDGTATIAQPGQLPTATRSPLTPPTAATVTQDVGTVRAMASVRADGATYAPPWEQAAVRLTATSWRTARPGFATVRTALHTAASTDGIQVSPREVNFLADSGRVQITVVNDLDIDVHDVTLTLQPDNPRLRVDTPQVVLRVGARSRTTVTFEVTAYAAGLVPITTTLSAPDGTVLRSDAPVRIRVSPTGQWIYWVIGAVAVGLLVAGIWRGTRRGEPAPTTDPDEDVPT